MLLKHGMHINSSLPDVLEQGGLAWRVNGTFTSKSENFAKTAVETCYAQNRRPVSLYLAVSEELQFDTRIFVTARLLTHATSPMLFVQMYIQIQVIQIMHLVKVKVKRLPNSKYCIRPCRLFPTWFQLKSMTLVAQETTGRGSIPNRRVTPH